MTKVMNVIDKWFGATIKAYGFDFTVYIGFALALLSIVLGIFSVNFEDLVVGYILFLLVDMRLANRSLYEYHDDNYEENE